jgi:sterol desaturase/sphingolipid hydroxylase (fatty acid hydroxylase superfamily)
MQWLAMFSPFRTFVLAAAIFIPFERLFTERREQPVLRRGWGTDLMTGVINGLILSSVVLAILAAIDSIARAEAPTARLWMESTPFWAQALVAIVVGDLGIYVVHRLMHTVPWLWRFHAVHHSAEELDWLVALRFHPLDLFLMRLGSLAPLVALDVSTAAVAVFVTLFAWQSWLVHANVRLGYGPLRWALVSPEFHHWHHSADREAFDRNYASIFAVWDFVFRTVYLPRARRPTRYGTEEFVPRGYVERLYQPLLREPRNPQILGFSILKSSDPSISDLP